MVGCGEIGVARYRDK